VPLITEEPLTHRKNYITDKYVTSRTDYVICKESVHPEEGITGFTVRALLFLKIFIPTSSLSENVLVSKKNAVHPSILPEDISVPTECTPIYKLN